MSIALITGATSGFGKATAIRFAEHGYNVIITGRRQDRLNELEDYIKENFEVDVLTLCFDVRNREETINELNAIPHDWKDVTVLVNNAGLAAGLSTIQDGDIDDWETMIDTNLKGLLYVTRTVSPWMIKNNNGHIINIGSIAGKEVYPKGNVYCATKFAVDALSQAMRIDMLPHGIRVTAIHPGAAETEFSLVRYHGDAEKAKSVYAGYEPLIADDIADIAYFAASRPAHVVLNEIVVTPTAQAAPPYWHKNL
jgi:3-hydroxy acid dehydrogenase/malonic semialdehyde reductase